MKFIITIASNQRIQCCYYNNDGTHRLLPYQGEVEGSPSAEKLRLLIKQICRERLSIDYASQGGDLNLCLLFTGDVPETVRSSIKSSLISDHLGLVSIMDFEALAACYFVRAGKIDRQNRPLAIFLSVCNNDIVAQAVSTPDLSIIGTRKFQGFGKDKRMETALDKIWEEASYQTSNPREKEEPFIRQAVSEFLQSGKYSQREWQLSDFRCQATLTQDLLKELQKDQIIELNHSLSLYVDNLKYTHNMCGIFLLSSSIGSYFCDGLTSFINPVVVGVEEERQILNLALEIQEKNLHPIEMLNSSVQADSEVEILDSDTLNTVSTIDAPVTVGSEDEKCKIGTDVLTFEQARRFSIKYALKQSGVLFNKKKTLSITVSIEGDKTLPCPCSVTLSAERFAVYTPEKCFVEELEKGSSGPFELGPYQLPLQGLPKSDIIFVQVWPVDKSVAPSLFKNNKIEIQIK